ncbi:anastral spindle 2 [Cochliomyia hominivorax]
MFQPETEDMLPRMAPKPSAAIPSGVSSEGIVRPQVPEVSILFGQQETNLPQQPLNSKNNAPQQSYAAWKKQMLPKVTYPSAAANMADIQQMPEQSNNNMIVHDYNAPRTNLYPLRTNTNPNINIATNVNGNGYSGVTNPLTYRRSLESCNNNMAFQQIQQLSPLATQTPFTALKTVTMPTSVTNSRDVLTICAGTQTDAIVESTSNYAQNMQNGLHTNLATREDVDGVRQMLVEMQHEQQRIAKMLEALLFNAKQQATVKTQTRDIAVQAECIESDNEPYVNGGIPLLSEQPKNKFLQHLKPANNVLQTPKGKPMAQSTTYRPNTPQSQPEIASGDIYQQMTSKPPTVMPKSASDTSLAMNELALKYLPNEKLAELLKELNMDCPTTTTANVLPTTPVRGNIEKFEKGPSDISNASYKYLKKYRLLPEDHEEDDSNNNNNNLEENIENVNENQMPLYNSPQYNNIRNTPLNQRQTPTNKCSPYAVATNRLPLSPLARASPPPLQSTATQQHIVNLENIKHQPKFL